MLCVYIYGSLSTLYGCALLFTRYFVHKKKGNLIIGIVEKAQETRPRMRSGHLGHA